MKLNRAILFTVVVGANEKSDHRVYAVMADTIERAMQAALDDDREAFGAANDPEFELSPRPPQPESVVLKVQRAEGEFIALVAVP